MYLSNQIKIRFIIYFRHYFNAGINYSPFKTKRKLFKGIVKNAEDRKKDSEFDTV